MSNTHLFTSALFLSPMPSFPLVLPLWQIFFFWLFSFYHLDTGLQYCISLYLLSASSSCPVWSFPTIITDPFSALTAFLCSFWQASYHGLVVFRCYYLRISFFFPFLPLSLPPFVCPSLPSSLFGLTSGTLLLLTLHSDCSLNARGTI